MTDWHPLVVVPALGSALRALTRAAAAGSDDEPRLRSLDDDSKLELRFVLAVAGLFVPIVIVAHYLLYPR